MVHYEMIQGEKETVAEQILHMYNDPNREIVNVIYSAICEDVFTVVPTHHVIVYYKKTAYES